MNRLEEYGYAGLYKALKHKYKYALSTNLPCVSRRSLGASLYFPRINLSSRVLWQSFSSQIYYRYLLSVEFVINQSTINFKSGQSVLAIHDSPHIVEISEDGVMTYHFYYLSRATTLNSANTKLVTLAQGLRPERRLAPLARG